MKKIVSIIIAIFALIAFPNFTFASNSDDRRMISLLDDALSTIEQTAQSANETLDTAETVAEGATLIDMLVSSHP